MDHALNHSMSPFEKLLRSSPTTVTSAAGAGAGVTGATSAFSSLASLALEQEDENATRIIKTQHTSVAFPHPGKVRDNKTRGVVRPLHGHAGEDAFVVAHTPYVSMYGIADGIREWELKGIDSGILSRAVVEAAGKIMEETGITDPALILQQAWAAARAQDIQGSTTVCLVTVDLEEALMRVANIGDSGCRLLRRAPGASASSMVFKSTKLQHSFGKPFQLGHHSMSSEPQDAAVATVPVQSGDVLVCASDGLFDNVSDDAIAQIVDGAKDSKENLAMLLGKAAFAASVDKTADTPFAQQATEALDMFYAGGKPDDITVVAVRILPAH